ILMLFFLSELFDMKNNNIQKLTWVSSIAFLLCFSMYLIDYRASIESVYAPTYPKWKEELVKHQADSTYNPRIHPGTDPWEVKL
ncbi:MAG: hypothetical protein ABI388_07775, partial [Bacteroidia bacterium]